MKHFTYFFLMLLFFGATGLTAQTRLADSIALVGLYNATGGPLWKNTWDLSQTIDNWYGVTLDYSLTGGRVICLDLDGTSGCNNFSFPGGNRLVGSLPDLNLDELQQLYLNKNQLGGPIPNFTNLANLQFLNLANNQLSGAIPDFISLINLQELSLFTNQLNGAIPNFTNLSSLQKLNSHSNQLSGAIPNFTNLSNLQELNLGSNQLSGAIPNFTNLDNLQELYLSSNQLSGAIPNFTNLANLQELYLNSNQLSGAIPNFTNLDNLQELNLSNNQLSGTIPNFTNLANLKNLFFSYNQLNGTIPNFTGLPNLGTLNLISNHLSGAIPNFTGLPMLRSMHLSNNQLSGAIPNFTNLINLDRLYLDNNQLNNSIPSFTNLPKINWLDLKINQFTFEDLLNSFQNNHNLCSANNGFYIYHSQDSVCIQDSIYISLGAPFTIDLQIDDTVTTSTYYWFKNGVFFDSTTVNELYFPIVQQSDLDVYHCLITNPHTPFLTLNSRAKTLLLCTISSSLATNDINCNGANNGLATVNTSGGTPPYSYLWSNGNTAATASGLSSGSYSVTLTDANNCQEISSIQITEPDALALNLQNSNQISCNGNTDGAANYTATGGTLPYSYLWSNGNTTTTASGLSAGTYSVTLTDANNCQEISSIQITEPDALALNLQNSSQISCNGNTDGAASYIASGGTLPYTYLWSNGNTTTTASSLSAGSYTVTLTDANNCQQIASIQITEPDALALNIQNSTQISCNGNIDGTANYAASGGTLPYSYLWSNGNTTTTASGLSAGTYTVTLTDANNCQEISSIQITEPNALALNLQNSTQITCNGNTDGTASYAATGGTLPYTYLWSNGNTTATASGLSAGSYSVTLTDANNCQEISSILITEPDALTLNLQNSTQISCNGNTDGAASYTATGGTLPYTYLWSNGNTVATASGLSAGTYSVTLTDDNNCQQISSIQITEPDALALNLQNSTQITCNGNTDGAASYAATGGTLPYTYLWSNGNIAATASGLSAGSYSVTLTDGNNCQEISSIQITEPDALALNLLSSTPITCNGNTDGAASYTATGGTLPYSYLWSNGNTTATASGLSAGSYSVTLTDGNNCQQISSIQITEPDAIALNVISSTPITCSGNTDGAATFAVTGGTSPYSYLWSNGNTTTTATGLSAGSYSVSITDALNCLYIASVIIDDLSLSLDTVIVTASSCGLNNGQVEILATNGNPPLQYSIDGGIAYATVTTFPNQYSGTYLVYVKDQDGCLDSTTIILNDLTPMLDSITAVPSDCDVDNGSLTAYITNGQPPYSYLWNTIPQQTGQSATSLATGTYELTVSDDNGCMITALGDLIDPMSLNTPESDYVVCGTPYVILGTNYYGNSFVWSTGATSNTISVNQAGEYSITVTDFYNCLFIDTVEVIQIPFNPQIGNDTTIVMDTEAFLEASGGTSYEWWPTADLSCGNCPNPVATPTDTTEYFVAIDIPSGCPDTLSMMVYTVESLDETVVIPDVITPNGDGENDIWVIVNIDQFPLNRVFIVNRWGDVVYQATPYNNDWAGTHNGKLLPQGTYYYYVELDVNQVETRKGSISLIR